MGVTLPPLGRGRHTGREKDVGAPPRCAEPRNSGALQQARGMKSHRRRLLQAAPDVALDRAANHRAAVPSNRQKGGDQGGSAKCAFPLAEAVPPRQSRSVLQPRRWGGCRPGPAGAPATRASPADPRGAATLPRPPPPPPAPRPIQSLPTPALLKLLDPRPHRCPASFRSAAGTETLPKPPEQSLVKAAGRGATKSGDGSGPRSAFQSWKAG